MTTMWDGSRLLTHVTDYKDGLYDVYFVDNGEDKSGVPEKELRPLDTNIFHTFTHTNKSTNKQAH